jgi:hypothetical protein
VSGTCTVSLKGNTNSDNSGTVISVTEAGETYTTSTGTRVPANTTNGTVASSVATSNINNLFRMTITKGTVAIRNYYIFESSYALNGVGTCYARGIGHLDNVNMSTPLNCVVLNMSGGATTTAYWSTAHYF